MPRDASRPDPASSARSSLAALGRLREHAAPAPETLRERARALLAERFGPADSAPAEGFARGATGLLAEHTHYSDGFAMLMPLAQGTAVAVRSVSSAASRVAFEGDEATYDGTSTAGARATEAQAALALLCAASGRPVEAAAASAVPPACRDARRAALGVAAARAAAALAGRKEKETTGGWEGVRAALSEGGEPFSLAYVLAAARGEPPYWLLADTAARESLPVEAPSTDELGRGLVVVREGDRAGAQPPPFHRQRRREAEEALRRLREHGFDGLTAFRDLEHRDLDRALRRLPSALAPVARHLITENRRVQKLVRAARKGDWQFFGALLLMSHASCRDDWRSTTPALDAVVEAAEDADVDGLYGACPTGRGPCVLAVGRPAALPVFFRHAAEVLREQFDRDAEAMLL